MIWCVHKTLPVGQAAPRTHTGVYTKPQSHTLRKETTPIQGNGWNTFTCGDEEQKYAMDLHHHSSLLPQSYRWRHAQSTSEVSSEGAVLLPPQCCQNIPTRVFIYSTCFGNDSWGPLHHRAGNGSTVCFTHQISSAVYRRSFFSEWQCDLWLTKQINTQMKLRKNYL